MLRKILDARSEFIQAIMDDLLLARVFFGPVDEDLLDLFVVPLKDLYFGRLLDNDVDNFIELMSLFDHDILRLNHECLKHSFEKCGPFLLAVRERSEFI